MKLFEATAKIEMDRLPWLHIIRLTTPYDPKATTSTGRIAVQFVTGGTSSLPLGRAARQDWSYISLGEPYLSMYVHEIGHTLGLPHEHKRPDRGKYFNVDCSALKDDEGGVGPICTSEKECKGWSCKFTAMSDPLVYNFEGPYVTSSIMHYFERSAAKDFSSQPLTGIKPGIKVGRTDRPTLMDLLRVCSMYQDQCSGRGIRGDGILSPANGKECDPSCGKSDACTEDCKLKPFCGNKIVETGEDCDDGPSGSTTCTTSCKGKPVCGNGVVEGGEECVDGASGSPSCTTDCKKITCLKTWRVAPPPVMENIIVLAKQDSVHHWIKAQIRPPWFKPISQEGRVFVEPGQACNILCKAYTLGRDGCEEVTEQPACYYRYRLNVSGTCFTDHFTDDLDVMKELFVERVHGGRIRPRTGYDKGFFLYNAPHAGVLGNPFIRNIHNIQTRNQHKETTDQVVIEAVDDGFELLLDPFLESS
ncbi:zincin [Fusarium acutatum]|uniref:Zincin n=1 Tax=Fusarium acutatum TaxID=78861 RepID=A0A8H4JRC5_9HYPO|nr:zincin [Fusarium acutatum]